MEKHKNERKMSISWQRQDRVGSPKEELIMVRIIDSIIRKLTAKDQITRKKGTDQIKKLREQCAMNRIKGITDRDLKQKYISLVNRLLPLVDSKDWYARESALRGFGASLALISPYVPLEKRKRIAAKCLERLRDSDGRVRNAAVYQVRWLNTAISEDFAANTYLDLQNILDNERDEKIKRTIERALEEMYCPFLVHALESRGYVPMETIIP